MADALVAIGSALGAIAFCYCAVGWVNSWILARQLKPILDGSKKAFEDLRKGIDGD